jgi:AcrR family transcriptional regulator
MKAVTENIAAALPRAAAVFASQGLDGTRMEDIVEATGIPRPTLYYHFSSKEEILAWLLERLLRELAIEIGHVIDRDESARERLVAIVDVHLRVFAEHRELTVALLTDLGRITRIPELADAIWASFHEPVRKLLRAGEADGSLRGVDDELTASSIFGTVTMVGLHYLATGEPLDPGPTAAKINDLLLRGLATPTSQSTKGRTG